MLILRLEGEGVEYCTILYVLYCSLESNSQASKEAWRLLEATVVWCDHVGELLRGWSFAIWLDQTLSDLTLLFLLPLAERVTALRFSPFWLAYAALRRVSDQHRLSQRGMWLILIKPIRSCLKRIPRTPARVSGERIYNNSDDVGCLCTSQRLSWKTWPLSKISGKNYLLKKIGTHIIKTLGTGDILFSSWAVEKKKIGFWNVHKMNTRACKPMHTHVSSATLFQIPYLKYLRSHHPHRIWENYSTCAR